LYRPVRAQLDKEFAQNREKLEAIVEETRRRTGWRQTVEDAKLAHWMLVVLFAFGGGVLTAAWRGGQSWESTRHWRDNVDLQLRLNDTTHAAIIHDMVSLQGAIDRSALKLDTIVDRQSIVLSILCDGAEALDLRRLCRSARVFAPNGRQP
jgi:hypothetical protein